MSEYELPYKKFENERIANLEESQAKEIVRSMPVRVTINTNNHCNLQCQLCGFSSKTSTWREGGQKTTMEWELLTQVSEQLFPTAWEIIPTTRGEPLLYTNWEELIELISKNRCYLGLYTNGTLLDEKISIKFIPYLNDLKISFDGATKGTYENLRQGANYERVIDNIRLFNSLRKNYHYTFRPTLTIQYTLMKSNIEELPTVVKLASDIGADRIAASHVYIFYPDQKEESLLFHQDICDSNLNASQQIAKSLNITIFFPRGFSDPINSTCLFKCGTCSYLYKETWVEINGDVHPCFMLDSPVMGNLYEKSFQAIWNDIPYQTMRRTVNTESPYFFRCLNCPIRMQFDFNYVKGYNKAGFIFYEKE